jgi:NAD(P)-dependent dehydrogenase (short-subunit alcohol dehydrogenase family)
VIQDKVILVTGATDGIGQQTALHLARLGAHVIVHGRRIDAGEAVRDEIRRITHNEHIDFLLADFASLSQVRSMAAQILAKYDRLDVLINNAGIYLHERHLTADGFELTCSVNHLAPFLLTNLLLDLIKRSAPARIINVSSGMHQSGHIDFADLQSEKRFRGSSAYAATKLANVLFTYELADRLASTNVTVNCLNPGVVSTKMLRTSSGSLGGISPEEGAVTSVYLATSPEVENITGQYFVRKQSVPSSPASHDRTLQRELWRVSEQLTGLDQAK